MENIVFTHTTSIALGALFSMAATYVLFLLTFRRRQPVHDRWTGTIAPNKLAMGGIGAVGLLIGGYALHIVLTRTDIFFPITDWYIALGFAVFFLPAGYATLANCLSVYRVSWTYETITGPASFGIPPFGPTVRTIEFDDILVLGVDWTGSIYIQDDDGTKIRWNHYYNGHGVLRDVVAEIRPDLFDHDG